jgi:hypothetical protein
MLLSKRGSLIPGIEIMQALYKGKKKQEYYT